ncbi:MAG TPA: FAD-dependent oxidoreductase [Gaiellaceae bacterium]|nr:FAD-dependent oxidoreductase [Gaiellaceae bacterium]
MIFLVSSDAAVRGALATDLDRRFGNDTRILGANGRAAGIAHLEELADGAEPVALVIADEELDGATGVEFLAEAHALHPSAKRILLVERDYTAANPTVTAMTLGQIDYHLVKPWFPDQGLYPAVSDFLASWARAEPHRFALFRIAAPENSARSHEIRDLLYRFNVPYTFEPTDARTPTLVRHDGRVLVNPTNRELVEAVGGGTRIAGHAYDVAIVGAGPAGLSAAVYAASEGLETIVLERRASGGQAGASSRIRNVPGFTWGIGGHDLSYRACEQAWLLGANLVFAQEATSLRTAGDLHVLQLADGREVSARTVVLATGVTWRRLGIPELERLVGAGVFYGASASEMQAMRGRRVAIVGGGNSAGQAAAQLAKHAGEVTLLVRGDSLAKSMSEYLITELRATPNVSVRLGVEIVRGEGDERLRAVVVRDRARDTLERMALDGLFVMIGGEPHTDWLAGVVERDERGFVLTGSDASDDGDREPLLLETSAPGVFAIGDVRRGSVKRVTTAMGEGATAVHLVHEALERVRA